MSTVNLTNHHCLTSSTQLSNICKPLNSIGLNYFTLDRIYSDGSRNILTTAPSWIEFYYNSEFHDLSLFDPKGLPEKKCFNFWSQMLQNPVYKAAEEHDIAKGVTLVMKNESYWDFFSFGASNNSTIVTDSYLSNKKTELERFVLHFKDVGHELITESNRNIITFPDTPNDFHMEEEDIPLSRIKSADQYYQSTKVNRYYLDGDLKNEYLTRREIQIIDLILKGMLCTEMSEVIEIKPKTIEFHVARIKKKFKARTLVELALKVRDTHLYTLLKEDKGILLI